MLVLIFDMPMTAPSMLMMALRDIKNGRYDRHHHFYIFCISQQWIRVSYARCCKRNNSHRRIQQEQHPLFPFSKQVQTRLRMYS